MVAYEGIVTSSTQNLRPRRGPGAWTATAVCEACPGAADRAERRRASRVATGAPRHRSGDRRAQFGREGARVATSTGKRRRRCRGVAFLPFDLADHGGIPAWWRGSRPRSERSTCWSTTPPSGSKRRRSGLDPDGARVIAVNLSAPVLLAAAVAEGMAARGGGASSTSPPSRRFAVENALAYARQGAGGAGTRNLAWTSRRTGSSSRGRAGVRLDRLSVTEGVHEKETDWSGRSTSSTAKSPCAATPSRRGSRATWRGWRATRTRT
jgi:hypothetical protein